MWWEQTYKELQLEPLDVFMARRYAENCSNQNRTRESPYRQIGTTTWMLAAVIRYLSEVGTKNSAVLVEQDQARLTHSVDLFQRLISRKPHLRINSEIKNRGFFEFWNGSKLYGVSQQDFDRSVDLKALKLFHANEWYDRAIRRCQGPYDMVRIVRIVNGVATAYAEEDEYIMRLEPDGVEEYRKKAIPIVDPRSRNKAFHRDETPLQDDWDFATSAQTVPVPPVTAPQQKPPLYEVLKSAMTSPTGIKPVYTGIKPVYTGIKPVYVGLPRIHGKKPEQLIIDDLD